MDYDIEQYHRGSVALPGDMRRGARAISRYRTKAQVGVAAVDSVSDVTLAKIDSATAVTGHAMGAVMRVAQVQKHLELLSPEASGRLNMLADDHAVTMVDLVADHRRAIRQY